MKKFWLCLLMIFFSLSLFAGEFGEPPFLPISPFVMGQGGAFTAGSSGYYSLFYNPAGFALTEGTGLILPVAGYWSYMDMPAIFGTNWSDSQSKVDYHDNLLKKGGYGYGGSLGAGYIGGGFGLGTMLIVDSWYHGDRLASAMEGDLTATFGIVAGYAFTLDFSGIKLNLGAAIRPLYRVNARLSSADTVRIMNEFMASVSDPSQKFDFFSSISSVPAVHGIGVGFDAGAILDLGELDIGLSMRDIGRTNFLYTRNTLGEIGTGLSTFQPAPNGVAVSGDYFYTPMNLSLGLSWNPDFGIKSILDPTFVLDCQDIISILANLRTPLAMFHAGVNLDLLDGLFNVQAGINQGYFTFGLGARVFFAECNLAFFTRELGNEYGTTPNGGFTVDLRLRF
jgi:hypothetical protein